MNIFVFGGNRFMGKSLVNDLLEKKMNVTIFNRSGTGNKNAHIIKGNRNEVQDLNKIDFNLYDYIIDMCLFKPEQYELIKNHLLSSKSLRKYVFISSASVGNSDFGDYAKEKEQVENLLKKTSINYTILRPSYVVGEGSHRPRLGYFINKLKKKQPISIEGNGLSVINLVHVNDVVNEIYDSLFVNDKKTLILSNGQNLSVPNIVDKISSYLNIENFTLENGNDSPFLNTDFTFPKTKENYKELEEMLPNYVKWLKKEGNEKYGY